MAAVKCEVSDSSVATAPLMTAELAKVTREIVYRDWQVEGSAGAEAAVEIVVNEHGAIIFGKCG